MGDADFVLSPAAILRAHIDLADNNMYAELKNVLAVVRLRGSFWSHTASHRLSYGTWEMSVWLVNMSILDPLRAGCSVDMRG